MIENVTLLRYAPHHPLTRALKKKLVLPPQACHKVCLRFEYSLTHLTRFESDTIETHFDHHFIADFILDCLASPSKSINLCRVRLKICQLFSTSRLIYY